MAGQQTTIGTPRLLLRAAGPEDAVPLHNAMRDTEVMRYWSEPPHSTIERTRQWISGMMDSSQNGITDFIICLKSQFDSQDAPKVIGKIGIYRARPSNEIGFLIAREHWGKGLAKEALTHMLAYLFSLKTEPEQYSKDAETGSEGYTSLTASEVRGEWMYQSISADVDPRNAASIGVLKKFGFEEAGYEKDSYDIGGEWVDTLYLRLRREEWVRRNG